MNSVGRVTLYDQDVQEVDFTDEILAGLSRKPRKLSPKFFYDERGSELFMEITRQPEYYLTRTETSLLETHVDEIGDLIGGDLSLIEYGSGASEKIRILLNRLRPSIYAPLDISRDYLAQSAESLGRDFPWLDVHATCVDFTAEFSLPFTTGGRRVGFFPGSSIGNFDRPEAAAFLSRIRRLVGDEGGLLIGVDMKKDEQVLNRAYNDEQGITAAFNLNILAHINREYGADFDLSAFEHEASYNRDEGCIQMFLVSTRRQQVSVAGQKFELSAGEKIHTENSHKYTVDEVLTMAEDAGFPSSRVWQDQAGFFSVFYLHSH